jgi:hypothetical protein
MQMGWQESRVTLVPVDTEVNDEIARVRQQTDLPEIISFSSGQLEHSVKSVCEWLKAKGFQISDEVGKNALILEKDDIQLKLHPVNRQLSEITATFTLSPEAASHWNSWRVLVTNLCNQFNFVLFDLDRKSKAEPDSLIHVLSKTRSWQDLKIPYNWPDPEM